MKYSILLIGIMLFSAHAYAVTKTSNGGVWSVNATWSPVGVPGPVDDVILASGTTTIDNTFTSGSTVLTLTINGTAILNYSNNNLTLNVSGAFIMNGNSQITGGGNNRILNANSTFSVPAGQISTIGGVDLNVASTTSIAGYFSLANSNAGTKTFNNTITVAPGGTWDNTTGEDPVVNCSIVNNGTWTIPTGGNGRYDVRLGGPYTYSGNSEIAMTRLNLAGTFNSSVTNLGTLRLTKNGTDALTVTAGATFNNGNGVANALLSLASFITSVSAAGTVNFANANNTVDYTYSGNQNIYTTTYYNLTISNSGTKSLAGNTTVNNNVTITGSAILDASTNTLDGPANLIMTGTSELILSKTGVTLPEMTGTANSLGSSSTITFNGANAQTAKGSSVANPSTTNTYPYQNINISGNNVASTVDMSLVTLVNGNLVFTNRGRINSNPIMTVGGTFNFLTTIATTILSNDITVGNIIFNSGTLNYSNRTITIVGNNGTWTNNGGATFVNTSSNVYFKTGTNQQIAGTTGTVFNGLIIENVVVLNSVDIVTNGTLALNSGRLLTGVQNVYAQGLVTTGTGFVQGNLQKDVSAGFPNPLYEVGTISTYAPVQLNFAGVSVSGTVTVSSTALDHPGINSSNIEPNKTANRYWSIANNGVTFTTYNATFNYNATDLDGGASPLNFQLKWTANSINWSTTTTGVNTGSSAQMINEPIASLPNSSAVRQFICGEIIPTTGITNRTTGNPLSWNAKTTWIQNRTGTVTFNGTTAVVGVGTLFTTELTADAGCVNGDIIMLQAGAAACVVQGQVKTITNNTNLVLCANSVSSLSGGYGRQYIPQAIGDVVTIGNSNIADATTLVQYDMPAATLINSLNINTSATPRSTAQSVTHTAANLLTIQTNAAVNQPGAAVTDAWNINAGQASVLGNLTLGSGLDFNNRIGQINITTGTLSIGNLLYSAGVTAGNEVAARLNITGAGTVNLSGAMTFSNNFGCLTPAATSTFVYNGTAPSGQLLVFPSGSPVANFSYSNLTLNNTGGSGVTVSPTGQDLTTTNVTGNITIQNGSLITSDNTDITGNNAKNFTISNGSTFRMTGNSSTFPTGFGGGGCICLGTSAPFGTVSYEQTNNVTVASPAAGFGNLQVLNDGFVVTLPASLTVANNLTVGDGTTAPTLRGNTTVPLTVGGNVLINTNATINANSGNRLRTFNIAGNWTNNGTFTPSNTGGDNGVIFNGAGTQTIGGSSADGFGKLQINTSLTTNLVQLSKNISVSNQLILVKGGLDLNGKTLSITSGNTNGINGGATGAYIKSENTSAPYGSIDWSIGNNTGSYVYPFGKSSTQYIPFTFNVTVAGAPNGGSSIAVSTYATATNNTPFPTTVTNLNGTSGGNSVVDRFWIITPTGYATTKPTVTMTFTAVGTDAIPPSEKPGSIAAIAAVTASPAGIAAQRWNPSNYWDAALAGQTFANNAPAGGYFQVTVPGVTNFSPWTLADTSVPLPIGLTSFTAVSLTGKVEIKWRTETEENNDYFTIQKTADGESFIDVTDVKGAGTSTISKSYSTYDFKPSPGKWYYRLKQTDYDGHFTYSKLVAVEIADGLTWAVYPNPSDGASLNIDFNQGDLGKNTFVKLQDVGGKEIFQFTTGELTATELKLNMPQNLAPGIYIISIAVDQQIVRQKLIVR
ncbi:MAG TPA: T9SS type A sorting domain-containing protein [Cyclobacteriaceae bacterium]|nr:T9SS type A sorting domain-containing protein [Cyclobacteriaceae bacterium]